jgi:hypothetical protein
VATAFHPACDLTESLGLRSLTASEFAADFLNRNIHDFGARNPPARVPAAHFTAVKKLKTLQREVGGGAQNPNFAPHPLIVSDRQNIPLPATCDLSHVQVHGWLAGRSRQGASPAHERNRTRRPVWVRCTSTASKPG